MWDRKHFLSIYDLDTDDVKGLIDRALALKADHHKGTLKPLLKGKGMAMVFRKPSLRTRMSFEMGMVGLGGHAFYVSDQEIKLGQREAVCDVARVVSRYVDVIMIRTFDQKEVEGLAEYAAVPVINALTDLYHPCQVMADVMTVVEKKGRIVGLKVTFLGDGNNVANSWINAAAKLDFNLALGLPRGYEPDSEVLERARTDGARVEIVYDAAEAVRNADVVYTDVWVSMGMDTDTENRKAAMRAFQVNDTLLEAANKDAIVMHCLPAHRGEEITDSVMDSDRSVVYDEAENRMHIQRAIMLEVLGQ
jgi:ornithine carbamoyltransferase